MMYSLVVNFSFIMSFSMIFKNSFIIVCFKRLIIAAVSGLEPPTSLDWLPAYSNQLNYTAPFLVFYIATLVAILIVYPTIPAAPGCPWSPHFHVPTQYTLALWYRHFLSFLDAVRYGGVCVKLSKTSPFT